MEETDRLFPKRSKTSDGSIGDPAHQSRGSASDHNPDGGWVDAVDITDDDANGCDVGTLVYHLVASKDPRVKYLIHKGTIWKGYPNRGLPAFAPQPYTGANAHRLHAHVSINDEARTATGSWWPQSKPTPPKPKPPIVEESETMFILKAPEVVPRFVDPPLVVQISPETVKALKAGGVKELSFTKTEAVAIVKQATGELSD